MVPPPPPVLSSLLEARAPRRRPQHHARRSRTTTATLLAERHPAKQSPPDPPSRPVGVGVGMLLLLGQCAAFVGLVVVQRRAPAGPPDVANNLVAASYALGTAWTLAYCALDGSLWRLGSQCRAASDVVVILACHRGRCVLLELLELRLATYRRLWHAPSRSSLWSCH